MGYSRKKAKRGKGGWGHTFLKPRLEFFIYLLYPWKFQTNQSCTSGNCAKCKIALHHLEIPHIFFLATPGNSICYFFDTPGDSIISSTHPVRFFSGIAQNVKMVCVCFFQLILVGTLSILILSVKNRGWVFFLLNGQNPLSVT